MLQDVFNVAAQAVPFIAYGLSAYTAYRLAKSSVYTLGQKEEALITSFGKLVRTETEPGLKLKWPWPFNVVEAKIGTDLRQETENLSTKTKDDLFVGLPITVQYEVQDTGKFHFENRDPVANMMKAVSAAVRTTTSGKDFQELYNDRDHISETVIDHIKKTVDEYGINIRRIIIDEPHAPSEVQTAFNQVRASERLKEAARNEAEATRITIVEKAKAEKEADKLRGEGKAEFRKALFDQYATQITALVESGVGREEAIKVMLDTMHQDTMREIGQAGNMVIVAGTSGTETSSRIAELQTLRRSPASEQDRGGPVAAIVSAGPS